MTTPRGSIDDLCVNTIRTLCIDAVQQANSGHPGTPMAMAPVVYTLWQNFLRFDPDDPIWPNRDRFVLSSGHASTLLYSMLHLTGVKSVNEKYERLGTPTVSIDDLKGFRQLDSKCPGQPDLDLRQQPHHDRGQYFARLHRGRSRPLHGLRLARAAGRRRQRPRAPRRRIDDGQKREPPAKFDHCRKPYWLWRTAQAGYL